MANSTKPQKLRDNMPSPIMGAFITLHQSGMSAEAALARVMAQFGVTISAKLVKEWILQQNRTESLQFP